MPTFKTSRDSLHKGANHPTLSKREPKNFSARVATSHTHNKQKQPTKSKCTPVPKENIFSQSNSLIAFSEKECTLNSTGFNRTVLAHYDRGKSELQAAVLIQKIWRGYLTRRLLSQYIHEEEGRLQRVLADYQNRTEGQLGVTTLKQMKKKPKYFEEQSSIQSILPVSNLVKRSGAAPSESVRNSMRKPTNLSLQSEIYSYNSKQSRRTSLNEDILRLVGELKKVLDYQAKEAQRNAHQALLQQSADFAEVVEKSRAIQEINEQGQSFLDDVNAELSVISANISQIIYKPKSEYFTINLPEVPQRSYGHSTLLHYVNELCRQYNLKQNDLSELQFLCEILRDCAEQVGDQNLLGFTVELITEGFDLGDAKKRLESSGDKGALLEKWIGELNRREMSTIEEVAQTMESSSFLQMN